MMKRDVEQELKDNLDVCRQIAKSETFAQHVYAALCNHQFYPHNIDRLTYEPWSCSWRYAGEIIADIEQAGGDYMEYYCGGNEGTISPQVATMLQEMGWTGKSWVD